jgi:hypothetical protein
MIGRVSKLSPTKLLCLPEYGIASIRSGNISDIGLKSEWLSLLYDYLSNNQIKLASYFNIGKETGLAIFSGITWRCYLE